MRKQTIKMIIGLMCIALISLIAFQWYWIREAIEIRNNQFNQKVAESVQNVIHRLEKQDMVYLLQQRIENEQKNSQLDHMVQLKTMPSNRVQKAEIDPTIENYSRNIPKYDVIIGPHGEEIHYRTNNDGVATDVLSPNLKVLLDHDRIIDEFFKAQRLGVAGLEEFMARRLEDDKKIGLAFNQVFKESEQQYLDPNSARNSRIATQQPQNLSADLINGRSDKKLNSPKTIKSTNLDRVELLREVMQDIVYTNRPIHERINRFLLDTLLRKEFRENGIGLPFEFAVKVAEDDKMLFSTTSLKPEKWNGLAYHAALFPNEAVNGRSALYVYFPDQKSFILSNMGVMLSSSGILILVIMGCFYIAVSTILRQKKLSDIKNDFINNMTHEFKTPISTIALATGMAEENINKVDAGARVSKYLTIIRDENKRLGTHVEKVLQMALLDKGEVKLERIDTDIHVLIQNVINKNQVQIEQKEGVAKLELEATDFHLVCDPMHIYNVINNLVDNAIKYSPDHLSLTIKTENLKKGIAISIQDEGLGMSTEDQKRIFENFYRIPTGNLHDVKGFGLGLPYVKKMIEEHSGTVHVESDLGQGSTFHIWLPKLNY